MFSLTLLNFTCCEMHTHIQKIVNYSQHRNFVGIRDGTPEFEDVPDATSMDVGALLPAQSNLKPKISRRRPKWVSRKIRSFTNTNLDLFAKILTDIYLVRENAPCLFRKERFVIANYTSKQQLFYAIRLMIGDISSWRKSYKGPSSLEEEPLLMILEANDIQIQLGAHPYDKMFFTAVAIPMKNKEHKREALNSEIGFIFHTHPEPLKKMVQAPDPFLVFAESYALLASKKDVDKKKAEAVSPVYKWRICQNKVASVTEIKRTFNMGVTGRMTRKMLNINCLYLELSKIKRTKIVDSVLFSITRFLGVCDTGLPAIQPFGKKRIGALLIPLFAAEYCNCNTCSCCWDGSGGILERSVSFRSQETLCMSRGSFRGDFCCN